MKVVIREKLMQLLDEVPRLTDAYAQRDPDYPAKAAAFLKKVEDGLSQLRQTGGSFAASERANILATADGYRDPDIARDKLTDRKAARAVATIAVGRVEAMLRERIQHIDAELDDYRLKMSQLLAVSTARQPIPLPPTEPRSAWLRRVWGQLNVGDETQGMYGYLSAAVSMSDRLYLLDEVVSNLLSNGNGD
jgi:hypothetical protein